MLASVLKDRVQLQERTTVSGPLGQTETWKLVRMLYGRRIPLDVKAIAQYQQLDTQVSDKYIFRDTVTIELGKHRLLHGSKIYKPQSSAKHHDGATEVIVLEVQ